MNRSTLLSPIEAARFLGVAPQTLAIWRCEKRYPLPYVKVGALVRYRLGDLEHFVTRRTERSESPQA
jgi:hypothetical protein